MNEYKMCANSKMAIDMLEFIKRNYEKHSEQANVQKYIEALQMGIDALRKIEDVEKENDSLDISLETQRQIIIEQRTKIEELTNKIDVMCLEARLDTIKDFENSLRLKIYIPCDGHSNYGEIHEKDFNKIVQDIKEAIEAEKNNIEERISFEEPDYSTKKGSVK